MEKIGQWLKDSKRLKHLLLGVGVGLGADDLYCAEYVGIGVCYIGGCKTDGTSPKDTRTPEQKDALLKLLKELKKKYPYATVHGHNEFANKACPSFDCKTEYKNI